MEREVEDVVAVVAALGPDVALFGHSFGADLALQASDQAWSSSIWSLRLAAVRSPGAADRGGLQVQARGILGDERPLTVAAR